jgi:hypothetical protein
VKQVINLKDEPKFRRLERFMRLPKGVEKLHYRWQNGQEYRMTPRGWTHSLDYHRQVLAIGTAPAVLVNFGEPYKNGSEQLVYLCKTEEHQTAFARAITRLIGEQTE